MDVPIDRSCVRRAAVYSQCARCVNIRALAQRGGDQSSASCYLIGKQTKKKYLQELTIVAVFSNGVAMLLCCFCCSLLELYHFLVLYAGFWNFKGAVSDLNTFNDIQIISLKTGNKQLGP